MFDIAASYQGQISIALTSRWQLRLLAARSIECCHYGHSTT
ncbi:hypothetical protein [Chamaesiphon polymorphus]|nr:hypothetical protein [Chamaesiphon polymorphus]